MLPFVFSSLVQGKDFLLAFSESQVDHSPHSRLRGIQYVILDTCHSEVGTVVATEFLCRDN